MPSKQPTDKPRARQSSADAEFLKLAENLNWLIGSIREAAESDSGVELLSRIGRLLSSPLIPQNLSTDMAGWAALLKLENRRSYSKIKKRRGIPSHKPGQTQMFAATDIMRFSAMANDNDADGDEK